MSKFEYGFKKQDFLYGGIITAIIVAIVAVFGALGFCTKVFDPLGQALKNFHLSDGFFFSQARLSKVKETNHGVVLVDIADCDSREEIARIIRSINQAEPKALAVDIIFGKSIATSSYEDSLLVEALRESTNLILARRIIPQKDGYTIERSFFSDDIPCREGDVNFKLGIVRSFSTTAGIDEDSPSFISLIAEEAGLQIPSGEQLINYSPIDVVTVKPDSLASTDILKGQIVLLGDCGDLRDFHDIPVLIDGMPYTAGVNIIAQCVYTLQPHKRYYLCPIWLAILVGFVLTYLFCTFVSSPLSRNEKNKGLWITVSRWVVLILLLLITLFLFRVVHVYFPLTYWLLGVGLSGTATALFDFFKSKRTKK